MRSLFRRIKTKVGLMYVIIFLTLVVLGLSYGAFIYFTDGFKVSDLMISNLIYSIEIVEDGSTSEIENNKVIIPGNTKGYFYITISSVNPIDSKYTLGYKSNNNVDIKYTDKTNNLPNGLIKGYDEKTYNKKVKVVIDNTSNTGSTEILFNVFGGYTYNSYETISLKDGYLSVTGPYIELISGSKTLVSVVEKDTSCNTNINNCYYEDSISNYLQYPEDSDISKNLWRIIGTYNIDGKIITKMISISNYSTTLETLNSDLTTFNNTLIDREEYLESTNKFNCNSEGCNESTFNDIGLLSKYEYELIGSNSYLSNYLNYYVINNGNIELLDNSNNINLRAVVYVKNETKVKGSGTISNPYRFTTGEDINLLAYTLYGESTDKSYEWLKQNKAINKITCENGTIATWISEESAVKFTNVQVPDYCTIDFTDGYTVTLTAINGTVTSANSVNVGASGSTTFNVTPNDGYKLAGSTVTCTGTATGTITSTGVKISNVSENQTCTITLKGYTLEEIIIAKSKTNEDDIYNENGYRYEGSDPNNYIYMTNKSTNEQELWRIIGVFPDGENGENVIRVRRHYAQGSYPSIKYDSGGSTNHYPKTSMYTTLYNTYNTDKYSHTVNYRMYLGTTTTPTPLNVSEWFEAERGNTPGKTSSSEYSGSTSYVGSVGLIYPSDYGYGAIKSDECTRIVGLYYYTSSCSSKNWFYQGTRGSEQWTITPHATTSSYAYYIHYSGKIRYSDISVDYTRSYSPVMALEVGVEVQGSGTSSDPYIITN